MSDNLHDHDEFGDAHLRLASLRMQIDDMRPRHDVYHLKSTLDMRNTVRNLYFDAIHSARDIDKSPYASERHLENVFYTAVDELTQNGYSPRRVKQWLSTDYMEDDNYDPDYRINIHSMRENPMGNREEFIIWMDDTRQDLKQNGDMNDIKRIQLYMLNKIEKLAWRSHPQNERKRRMDATLSNRQYRYDRDNYRGKFFKILS